MRYTSLRDVLLPFPFLCLTRLPIGCGKVGGIPVSLCVTGESVGADGSFIGFNESSVIPCVGSGGCEMDVSCFSLQFTCGEQGTVSISH